MKLFLRIFAVASTISVGLLALASVVVVRSLPIDPEFTEFEGRFRTVLLGDSADRVRRVLGEPDAIETEFRLGQVEGFEAAYRRAEASVADRYLVYFRGIDLVFSVGVDSC
jgi:hypothetical protein